MTENGSLTDTSKIWFRRCRRTGPDPSRDSLGVFGSDCRRSIRTRFHQGQAETERGETRRPTQSDRAPTPEPIRAGVRYLELPVVAGPIESP